MDEQQIGFNGKYLTHFLDEQRKIKKTLKLHIYCVLALSNLYNKINNEFVIYCISV